MQATLVKLVPLMWKHFDDLFTYAQDKTQRKKWIRPPLVTQEAMQAEIQKALDDKAKGLRQPFAIQCLPTQKLIGSTSLYPDLYHKTAEIGSTWLATEFHKSGVNRECKYLLISHVFNELKLNRASFQTDVFNSRSRKAIEGLGAIYEGTLRHDKIVWNGRIRSSVIYSILREEWPNTNLYKQFIQ